MPTNQQRIPRGGISSWWRQWSKRESTIVAVILAVLLLTFTLSIISDSRTNTNSNSNTDTISELVPFTPLSKAQQNAAFCLDGSVPGYHMQRGFGSGSDNWLLHIEGGGWCNTISSCSSRKRTALGSSKYMEHQVQFSGLLSCNPLQNPDFFNWNRVKIRYCDGASFAGHPESEFKNGTKLFFRGQLIWNTLMDELLSIGMSTARQFGRPAKILQSIHSSTEIVSLYSCLEKALLTGCSAGGLATLIHCDDFREVMPKDANVKCLADAGFFLNEKDIAGNHTIESFYRDVVHLQGVSRSLNKDCVARSEPSKCFFPQEFIKNIKTPIFLVHPAYDFWQIRNILVPDASDPNDSWRRCRLNIYNCNPNLLEVLQGFRNSLLKTLSEFQQNEEIGMFINSCFVHCQTWMAETWHSPSSPRINNKTIAESVGDWYFNRKTAKHIDCPFPCNPTCYNLDFSRG